MDEFNNNQNADENEGMNEALTEQKPLDRQQAAGSESGFNTAQQQVQPQLPFLKNLAGWATFKAVIDIIVGALSCLGIITAAYGIPQIISGVKLLNATDDLKKHISTGDNTRIGDALFNFNKYFKISGIAIIIKIVFLILGIILYSVILAYLFNNAGDLFDNLPDNFSY